MTTVETTLARLESLITARAENVRASGEKWAGQFEEIDERLCRVAVFDFMRDNEMGSEADRFEGEIEEGVDDDRLNAMVEFLLYLSKMGYEEIAQRWAIINWFYEVNWDDSEYWEIAKEDHDRWSA